MILFLYHILQVPTTIVWIYLRSTSEMDHVEVFVVAKKVRRFQLKRTISSTRGRGAAHKTLILLLCSNPSYG